MGGPTTAGQRLATLGVAGLALWLVVAAARLAGPSTVVDFAGVAPEHLDETTRACLDSLATPVAFTYFASAPSSMPSAWRQVEPAVRRLLDALHAARPEVLGYRILDPELGGAPGAAYAARQGAAPIKVATITQDDEDERTLWSALAIHAGAGRAETLARIGPADLPHLEGWVIAHLKNHGATLKPRIAVVDGDRHTALVRSLEPLGDIEVLPANFDALPLNAELCFWLEPQESRPRQVESARRFLEAGGSLVIGGAALRVTRGSAGWRVATNPVWTEFAAQFGLEAPPDLLLDTTAGSRGDAGDPPPFFLRCTPAFFDARQLDGEARGALAFAAPTPLFPNRRAAAQLGYEPSALATTTPNARVVPAARGQFGPSDWQEAEPVAKQLLAVLLTPTDSWRGSVVALASGAMFSDSFLEAENFAHRVLLRTLVRTFAGDDRILRQEARPARTRIAAPGRTARGAWRLWAIGLVPATCLAFAWHRRRAQRRTPGWHAPRRLARGWVTAAGVILLLGITQRLLPGRWDLTQNHHHSVPRQTIRAAAALAPDLRAILWSSTPIPAALAPIERALRADLKALGCRVERQDPQSLSSRKRHRLEANGVTAFPVESRSGEVHSHTRATLAVELLHGDRSLMIPRLTPAVAEQRAFLLSLAVNRLAGQRPPRLAVVSDLPRLTPAEAYEDFQTHGLIPPQGTDVYQSFRRYLADMGFEVVHIDPKAPTLPAETDLLIWLQPRRDATPGLKVLADHLHRGGKAWVALQHFNIQQRQYRGAGFQTVYWPQPQFHDANALLEALGAPQVREVLMDVEHGALTLDTQVNRARRHFDPQTVALPFLIQTSHRHYAAGRRMQGIENLLFAWGNRLVLDKERLTANGLEAKVLVETSPRAWSYAWSGGWLPDSVLAGGPPHSQPSPLVVALSGNFPAFAVARTPEGRPDVQPTFARGHTQRQGELVLVGSSEMFKNTLLHAPGYDHAAFALSLCAAATLDEPLGRTLARRPRRRALPALHPAAKEGWRAGTIALPPLAILAWGIARRRRRP